VPSMLGAATFIYIASRQISRPNVSV